MAVSQGEPCEADYRTRFDRSDHDRLSTAVADAVAAATGDEVDETGIVLYDHVESEALDALYARDGDWELRFSVHEYAVTVDADGRIAVR